VIEERSTVEATFSCVELDTSTVMLLESQHAINDLQDFSALKRKRMGHLERGSEVTVAEISKQAEKRFRLPSLYLSPSPLLPTHLPIHISTSLNMPGALSVVPVSLPSSQPSRLYASRSRAESERSELIFSFPSLCLALAVAFSLSRSCPLLSSWILQ
jgi:hypothetical protein